jgi:hypothetical protein
MKILFLDIDGVLNCEACFKREREAWEAKGKPRDEHWNMLDSAHIAHLNRIVEETGAQIVVSSSWRGDPDLFGKLKGAKISANFLGITPRLPRPTGKSIEYCERGREVQAWLELHPEVKRYAILDDESDFFSSQPLFKSRWKEGLTEEISDRVIRYLNAV